jgi:DNA-binding protein HU-beta
MTREELTEKIAKDCKLSKAQADRAMKSMLDGITTSLKKGNKISFVGFGTFSITKRKARNGRNPQTGETIRIAAAKVPKFKPGLKLKTAVK